MRKCVTDVWAGVGFLVLAMAFGLQLSELSGVSRVFPQVLAIIVALGGVYFIVKGVVVLLRERHVVAEAGDTIAWGRIGLMSAMAVGYALIIKPLGFFASTYIFLLLSYLQLGDHSVPMLKRVLNGMLFAVLFCACIWVVFVKLLNVPTPVGILP